MWVWGGGSDVLEAKPVENPASRRMRMAWRRTWAKSSN